MYSTVPIVKTSKKATLVNTPIKKTRNKKLVLSEKIIKLQKKTCSTCVID